MGAPKGNQFWKARASHGRDKIFKTPNLMWEAALEYFEWNNNNPLEKAVVYQGEVSSKPEPIMRAMTVKGLCIFWDVNADYLTDFVDNLNMDTEEGKDFSRIVKKIRQIIDTQKFEGASAGLLNPNIIARDLGLTDKKEMDHSSKDGSMSNRSYTPEEYQNAQDSLNNSVKDLD